MEFQKNCSYSNFRMKKYRSFSMKNYTIIYVAVGLAFCQLVECCLTVSHLKKVSQPFVSPCIPQILCWQVPKPSRKSY
ncbi:hypothetical protein Trydic_g10577 [Trypoxylus dichotomus]